MMYCTDVFTVIINDITITIFTNKMELLFCTVNEDKSTLFWITLIHGT